MYISFGLSLTDVDQIHKKRSGDVQLVVSSHKPANILVCRPSPWVRIADQSS